MAGVLDQEGCDIAVIVVTYQTGNILFQCLQALLQQPQARQIIVVNNGNPLDVSQKLDCWAAAQPRLRVIHSACNLGFAAACNLAAQCAQAEFVALVNPDLIVSPQALALVAAALRRHPAAWAAGGGLLNPDGTEQRGGRRDVLTPWRMVVEVTGLWRLFPGHPYFSRFNWHCQPPLAGTVPVPVISGAFMMLPLARWRQLGGLDAAFFLHAEDMDLCLRIIKSGGLVLYCAHVPLYHQKGSSKASPVWVEWHKTVSLIHYFRKHFSDTYPRWCLKLLAALLWGRFTALAAARLVRRGPSAADDSGPGRDARPATAPPEVSTPGGCLE